MGSGCREPCDSALNADTCLDLGREKLSMLPFPLVCLDWGRETLPVLPFPFPLDWLQDNRDGVPVTPRFPMLQPDGYLDAAECVRACRYNVFGHIPGIAAETNQFSHQHQQDPRLAGSHASVPT